MARVVMNVCSGPSKKPCWMHFHNRTTLRARILWIDYCGREINYGFLDPGDYKLVASFEGHPWVCKDNTSKRVLHLNHEKYFTPTSAHLNAGKIIGCLPLIEVIISVPIFPLVELCADYVGKIIPSKECAETLELPVTLKEHVATCYRNQHCSWSEYEKN